MLNDDAARAAKGRDSLAYCAGQVRRHDHERYLTALFAPARRRPAILALYAFNLEVARIREAVSEPLLGRVRLQWWRDAIGAVYDRGNPPRHPVLEALAPAVHAHHLSREHFDRLLDAREHDLDEVPPPDLRALMAYAEASSGGLGMLVMEALGHAGGAARAAASEVGTAWALVGLIRAVPYHAAAGRVRLPMDLLSRWDVDADAIRKGPPPDGLNKVIEVIACNALELLANARAASLHVPRSARPGLLLATLAGAALEDIRRVGHDPFRLTPVAPWRPIRLVWAALRGSY